MAKPLFMMTQLPDKQSDMTKTNALRLKRNLGWYIQSSRKNKNVTFDDFVNNIKAPVCHHFHLHEWCSSTWCPFKGMDEAEMKSYTSIRSNSTNRKLSKK